MKHFSLIRLLFLLPVTGAALLGSCSSQTQPPIQNQKKEYTVPTKNEIKNKLTTEQYRVTQEDGTEPPFNNAYWDNKKTGLYVDIISGEPLFTSVEKFDSGTGWPSFWAPAKKESITEKKDISHGMTRIEVRSKIADSHLGHLFPDGPPPTGMRYCINSASLKFIPLENLEKEGYSEWIPHFKDPSVTPQAEKKD